MTRRATLLYFDAQPPRLVSSAVPLVHCDTLPVALDALRACEVLPAFVVAWSDPRDEAPPAFAQNARALHPHAPLWVMGCPLDARVRRLAQRRFAAATFSRDAISTVVDSFRAWAERACAREERILRHAHPAVLDEVELTILQAALDGSTNAQIARALGMGELGVQRCLEDCASKLMACSVDELLKRDL